MLLDRRRFSKHNVRYVFVSAGTHPCQPSVSKSGAQLSDKQYNLFIFIKPEFSTGVFCVCFNSHLTNPRRKLKLGCFLSLRKGSFELLQTREYKFKIELRMAPPEVSTIYPWGDEDITLVINDF